MTEILLRAQGFGYFAGFHSDDPNFCKSMSVYCSYNYTSIHYNTTES